MKVLFDHNLSPRLAHALHAILSDQHAIVALRDRFDVRITDVELIAALSQDGNWVVISGDYRITRNRAERQAFQQSRLTGFFMAPALKKLSPIQQLGRLCFLWPNIEKLADATQPGALFELPVRSTRIRQLKL